MPPDVHPGWADRERDPARRQEGPARPDLPHGAEKVLGLLQTLLRGPEHPAGLHRAPGGPDLPQHLHRQGPEEDEQQALQPCRPRVQALERPQPQVPDAPTTATAAAREPRNKSQQHKAAEARGFPEENIGAEKDVRLAGGKIQTAEAAAPERGSQRRRRRRRRRLPEGYYGVGLGGGDRKQPEVLLQRDQAGRRRLR